MSDPRAIAATTLALKTLLRQAFVASDLPRLAEAAITALPPDRVKVGADEAAQMNVYLRHAEPSAAWRNIGLASHDTSGARIANPPLALELHYILSAYAAQDLDAELLLGHALLALHEAPVLSGARLRALLEDSPLVDCGIDEQVEAIRIVADPLGSEELSRLWSALQAHARPSITCRIGVVLIESRRFVREGLPVRERALHVRSMRRPRIDRVEPIVNRPGGTLVLRGKSLSATLVRVRFPSGIVAPVSVSDERIDVTLPASQPAGPFTVQVLHEIDFGGPVEPHHGSESNQAVAALSPAIATDLDPPPEVARGETLTLAIEPPVRRGQSVRVLLSGIALPAEPFEPGGPDSVSTISVTVPEVFAATEHLVQVSVDGVSSALEVDATGQYVGPRVRVT